MGSGMVSNIREHYRVTCPLLCFTFRISTINGTYFPRQESTDHILVENISMGGMKFHSHLFLPPNPNTIIRVSGKLEGEDVEASGRICWHQKSVAGNVYGLQFIEPIPIFPLITNMERLVRKRIPLEQSSVCHAKCEHQACLSVYQKLQTTLITYNDEKTNTGT